MSFTLFRADTCGRGACMLVVNSWHRGPIQEVAPTCAGPPSIHHCQVFTKKMMTITANAASILIPRVCLCRVLRDRLVHMHAAGQEL
jgi:hypothetical protein